ncbi:MAG: LamG-like jellyroll fold domain-containing protein [Anaerohalosphaeraceae bacterium]
MKRIAVLMMAAAFMTAVNAEVIYSDDFQSYAVANPAGADFLANWTVGGPGGANSSRIFATNNFGTTIPVTKVWITLVDNMSITTQNGITVASDTFYEFSVMLACETYDGTRQVRTSYDLLVGQDAATATSIIGGPVTVIAKGDNWLVDDSKEDHIFTQNFKTGTLNAGDKLFIRVTFLGQYLGSKPFFCVDDVMISKTPYPALVSPSNGAVNQPVNVQLSWWAPAMYTPVGYNVYLDPNALNLTAADADYYIPAQAGTTYTPSPALANDTTYYWRVEALEPNLVAPYTPISHSSPVWSFTTVPQTPVIVTEPADMWVAAGETAVFTVEAINPYTMDSTGMAYEWYKVGQTGILSTTTTLEISDAQLDDEGLYYCKAIITANGASKETRQAALSLEKLIGHWPFDGNLNDVVGGNNAIPSTDVSYAAGIVAPGDAIDFPISATAVSAYIATTAYANPNWTLAWWDKATDTTGRQWESMIASGPTTGYELLEVDRYNSLDYTGGFNTAPGTWLSPGQYPRQLWFHHVLSYNGATGVCTWYINGQSVGTMTGLRLFADYDEALYIGNCKNGSQPFGGSIDDLRLYNYPLDAWGAADLYVTVTGESICVERPMMDISGPLGEPDCRVDLYDITKFAESWLDCGRSPQSLCQ